MKTSERVVLDNNALISRLLFPKSVPGQAVRKAMHEARVLASEATLTELATVLSRPKFNRYVTVGDRQDYVRLLGRIVEMVPITYAIRACRDAKDDKFLELAVNGEAHLIVTGDKDLLALNPFREIPILTPAEYLAR